MNLPNYIPNPPCGICDFSSFSDATTHSVVNNSSSPRMHMIAHCVIGNKKKEFAELVVRSYNKQYECGKISTI